MHPTPSKQVTEQATASIADNSLPGQNQCIYLWNRMHIVANIAIYGMPTYELNGWARCITIAKFSLYYTT